MAGRHPSPPAFFLFIFIIFSLLSILHVMARPLNTLGLQGDAINEKLAEGIFLDSSHKVVKSSMPSSNKEGGHTSNNVFSTLIEVDHSGPSPVEGHGHANNEEPEGTFLDLSHKAMKSTIMPNSNVAGGNKYENAFPTLIEVDHSGPSPGEGHGHVSDEQPEDSFQDLSHKAIKSSMTSSNVEGGHTYKNIFPALIEVDHSGPSPGEGHGDASNEKPERTFLKLSQKAVKTSMPSSNVEGDYTYNNIFPTLIEVDHSGPSPGEGNGYANNEEPEGIFLKAVKSPMPSSNVEGGHTYKNAFPSLIEVQHSGPSPGEGHGHVSNEEPEGIIQVSSHNVAKSSMPGISNMEGGRTYQNNIFPTLIEVDHSGPSPGEGHGQASNGEPEGIFQDSSHKIIANSSLPGPSNIQSGHTYQNVFPTLIEVDHSGPSPGEGHGNVSASHDGLHY